MRQSKSPLKIFANLPNHYAHTNAAFSPDEQLVFNGTSVEREGNSGGLICLFDRRKLELVSRVGISATLSVIRCAWHPKINQVTFNYFPGPVDFDIYVYLLTVGPKAHHSSFDDDQLM